MKPLLAASVDSPIRVEKSGVHGWGVFATRHLAAGERLIEYVGEIISMTEAIARRRATASGAGA